MNPEAVSSEGIRYFRQKIIRWGKKHYASFPWRTDANLWHRLVAEIMLQRTNAEQVLPAYLTFCAKYPTPSHYLKDSDHTTFQTLGLLWREPLLERLAGILVNSDIPQEREKLLELPGIGEYIASAFRSLHLGIRDSIIDSNVVRLYGRFFGFLTDGETRRKRWLIELARALTPARQFTAYNYGVIDFTRQICQPRPLCPHCPIRKKCAYGTKSIPVNR